MDNIPSHISRQIPEWFVLYGLDFRPVFPRFKDGPICYETKLRNLFVKIIKCDYETWKIFVSNSLHVFCNSSNYDDFTYTQLRNTIDEIDSVLDGQFLESRISRVEIGINLEDYDTKNWKSYKGKSFYPMVNSGKVYGKKAILNEYVIKGYDKTFEQKKHFGRKLNASITRIEKQVKYMRHYQNKAKRISLMKVNDLKNKDILVSMYSDFRNCISKIQLSNELDFSCMQYLKDIRVASLFQIKAAIEQVKKRHYDTYKKDKRHFNFLVQEQRETAGNEMKELCSMLDDKFNYLMNS